MIGKLSDLVPEAEKICGKNRVYNLLLNALCNIDEIDSDFIQMNKDIAECWQSPTKPENLIINHGEYIHKHGDGVKNLISELRNKPDSNRALLSLIDLEDIIRSGDHPIPSFLILQFGLSSPDKKTLYCTAYFRALEVSKFLPINIAEISIIARQIRDNFPEIEMFDLRINAFTAYSKPNFYCLEMSGMDLESNRGTLTSCLLDGDYKEVISFLNSKLKSESYIFTNGMSELYNALKRYPEKFDNLLILSVEQALGKMKELKKIREKASHSQRVVELQCEINDHITSALKYFHA